MAGDRLDSAGTVKIKTLEEALLQLQRIHGTVELYALALKQNQPTTAFVVALKRSLPSLAANLKAQFGLISDQVTSVALATSRGSSEVMRVRALREGVAMVKQALEIGVTQTKLKHTVKG
jgi:hypothetical protein